MAMKVLAFSFLLGPAASIQKPSNNYRMVVSTTEFCVDLTDSDGKKQLCGASTLEDTYGETIPGMSSGSLTYQSDVIAASDGTVTIQNSPLRPYVLSMSVQNSTHTAEMQLYNGKASVVAEGRSAIPLPSRNTRASLEKDGFERKGTTVVNGRVCVRYVKSTGFEEDDKGVTYGMLFASGVVPDTWTLYLDAQNGQWVKMDATNSHNPGVIYQSSTFSQHTSLPGDTDLETAVNEAFATYSTTPILLHTCSDPSAVDAQREEHKKGMGLSSTEGGTVPMGARMGKIRQESSEAREFYSEKRFVDWMPSKGDTSLASGSFRGINYFTIEDRSHDAEYFRRPSHRKLSILDFAYPKACKTTDTKCLTLKIESPKGAIMSANMSFNFNDPGNNRAVKLKLIVVLRSELMKSELNLIADGCATLWKYGVSKLKLEIALCIAGSNKTNPDGSLKIVAQATLQLSATVYGYGVHPSIPGTLTAEIKSPTDIKLHGSLEVGADVAWKSAGAHAGLDIDAYTTQDNSKIWMFQSSAYFTAYVDTFIYSNTWEGRHPLWEAGPVNF